ncbi:F-box/LRR-repeat protein 4 [Spatholobus suberectus]|nr:F-box/LRR-repeat protein 4 [Spatholobus suberectus]
MASNSMDGNTGSRSRLCINDVLMDDMLLLILGRVESEKDKKTFGLVCKRWLRLQSTETKKLTARAGDLHMLRRMADRFTRLVELDLSPTSAISRSYYSDVADSDLAVIANVFPCLRVLNLGYCRGITDVGMKAIGEGLPLLQSLDVSYCSRLTDKGLSAVAKGCCDLRILRAASCGFVTDGVLEALSKNCPNLDELGLKLTSVTDDGLINLASGCRQIRFLNLNNCSNVSDVGVSTISRACSSSLKTLKLLRCYKIGDGTILSLAKFCGNLETLIICGCRDVSAGAVMLLATACGSSLKILSIDECQNISDSSVGCILSQCRNLEVLDIGFCEKLTDAAFQLISNEEPGLSLKILDIRSCPKITVAGIGILVGKCPFLEYLNVSKCPHITKADLEGADFHFPECCKIHV